MAKLSTLEGRQRAIQGKMAKLDGQWGGDFSNVTHAVAELARRRYRHQYVRLGRAAGQLDRAGAPVDALEKRTAAKNGEAPPCGRALGGGTGRAEGGVTVLLVVFRARAVPRVVCWCIVTSSSRLRLRLFTSRGSTGGETPRVADSASVLQAAKLASVLGRAARQN